MKRYNKFTDYLDDVLIAFDTLQHIAKRYNNKGFNILSLERRIRQFYPQFRVLFGNEKNNYTNYAVFNDMIRIPLSRDNKSIMTWITEIDVLSHTTDKVIGIFTPNLFLDEYLMSKQLPNSSAFETQRGTFYINSIFPTY